MKALVSGGSGVLGARLVEGLVRAGWLVRALALPDDPCNAKLSDVDCELWEGDITKPETLEGAFEGVDTVYHLAAVILSYDPGVFERVNLRGTANMLEGAAAARVKHFIYVSSASVTYRNRTPYAESKLAAEELVKSQRGMTHTILRPTLVYDESGGEEFMLFLDSLRRFPVVPFIGRGHARKRPVWAGDLVEGMLAIAGKEKTYGKTYNLSGGESIRIVDLARLMLHQVGEDKPFVPIPERFWWVAAGVLQATMKKPPLTRNAVRGIIEHADLDCSLARRDLGYDPLGVREGLPQHFPRAVSTKRH